MIELLLLAFAATIWTGPACDDARQRRRERRWFPDARIVPIVGCRKCRRTHCHWHS